MRGKKQPTKSTIFLGILFWMLGSIFDVVSAQEALRGIRLSYQLPVSEEFDDSEDETYIIEDWSEERSGYGGGVVFKNGFGVGWTTMDREIKLTTTFKQYFNLVSSTTETVEATFLDLSYSLESFPLTIGYGWLLDAASEVIYHNPQCSIFNRETTSAEGSSFFVDLGIPIGDRWNILVGYRRINTTFTFAGTTGTWDRDWNVLYTGVFWEFM